MLIVGLDCTSKLGSVLVTSVSNMLRNTRTVCMHTAKTEEADVVNVHRGQKKERGRRRDYMLVSKYAAAQHVAARSHIYEVVVQKRRHPTAQKI